MVTIIPPSEQNNITVSSPAPTAIQTTQIPEQETVTIIESTEKATDRNTSDERATLIALNKDFTQQIERLKADKKVFIIERAGKYMKRINTYENETARRVTIMKKLEVSVEQRKHTMVQLEKQLRNYDELLTSAESFTTKECEEANIDIDDITARGAKDAAKYKALNAENIAEQSKLLRYGDDLLKFEEAMQRNQLQIDKITKDADDIYTSIIEYFTEFQTKLADAAGQD